MRRLLGALLLSFLAASAVEAGQLDASWTAPTTNTDGSALTDLASYRLYWVLFPQIPCPGTQFIVVPSATASPAPNTIVTRNIVGLTQAMTYTAMVTAVDTQGNESACSAQASAAARPDPVGNFTLSVTKAGTGQGTVGSAPAGIACGTTCASAFPSTAVVALTATPAAGSSFAGWSGACTGTGACSAAMTAARAVTASFTLTPPPPADPSFTINGPAEGASVGGLITYEAIPVNAPGFQGGSGPSGSNRFDFALKRLADGVTVAANTELGTPFCFMGDPGATTPCVQFDTRTVANGAYQMSITMFYGTVTVNKTLNLTIQQSAPPAGITNFQLNLHK